jgi:hypothetical protein
MILRARNGRRDMAKLPQWIRQTAQRLSQIVAVAARLKWRDSEPKTSEGSAAMVVDLPGSPA